MANLGRKYTCYSCQTKFYDLGKPLPVCPKCGADQREADEAPVYTSPRRSARVVEEPAIDEEFESEDVSRPEAAEEEEEILVDQEEPEDEEEEEDL